MNDSLTASVRQRLLNLSQARNYEFQLTLTHYAIERLLYRLSQSTAGDGFLLKGAMLFNLWTGELHRPTRDLDLSGQGDPSTDRLHLIFQDLCALTVAPDGLIFDPDSVQITPIRELQEYDGQRVKLTAHLANARIPLQIDIGFGDAVTPAPVTVEYPTLLDFPAPQLRIYPKETVVAEKTQALVALGMANSRMKDFYDLWFLANKFSFAGEPLADAMSATFARRRTPIPADQPLGLTETFYHHLQKQQQWRAFLSRNEIELDENSFADIIDELRKFLMPPLVAARNQTHFVATWTDRSWRDS